MDGSANMAAGASDEFFRAFVHATGDTSLLNSDGTFTEALRMRARRALLAIACGQGERGRDVVKKLVEDTDALGIERQKDVAAAIAPHVAATESRPEYAIGPDVSRAFADYIEFRENRDAGKKWGTLEEYLKQGDMLLPRSEIAEAVTRLLDDPKNAPVLAETVRLYAEAAKGETDGLFGAARTRVEIWRDAEKAAQDNLAPKMRFSIRSEKDGKEEKIVVGERPYIRTNQPPDRSYGSDPGLPGATEGQDGRSAACRAIDLLDSLPNLPPRVKAATANFKALADAIATGKTPKGWKNPVTAENFLGTLTGFGFKKASPTSAYMVLPDCSIRISDHAGDAGRFVKDNNWSILLESRRFGKPFNKDAKKNVVEFKIRRSYLKDSPERITHLLQSMAEFAVNGEIHDTIGALEYRFSGSDEYITTAIERLKEDARERGDEEAIAKLNAELPSFKKNFFGDWENDPENASKIVDDDGRPLVVYRGAEFDPLAQEPGKGIIKPEAYFTANPEYAKRYGSVRAYYLNIRRPFDIRDPECAKDFASVYPGVKLARGKSGALDWAEAATVDGEFLKENFGDKYDGIIFDEASDWAMEGNLPKWRGLSYVPLDGGAQVKSATDNNGNFSGHPDTRYSVTAQTETPQFKNFFGDWENDPENASKVVDRAGRPRVVYHGTPNGKFWTFDKNRIGETWNADETGFFFTSDKSQAEEYTKPYFRESTADPNLVAVYLSIKNPLVVDRAWWQKNFGRDDIYKHDAIEIWDTEQSTILDAMHQGGHDGVIIDPNPMGGAAKMYMVPEPTQIKSATDNTGAFDPRNPDIRYSVTAQRVTPEEDATYADAVKRGDEEAIAKLNAELPSFKKNFFGDWEKDPENASKVVDKDGKPLVVWHGDMDPSFTVFDKGQIRRGHGFWFAKDQGEAAGYALDAEPRAFFLNIRNPAREADLKGKLLDDYHANGGAGASWKAFIWDGHASEFLRSRGYDGIEFEGKYIVFEPTQIKSATDNTGAFDPRNPDVRYSIVSLAGRDVAVVDDLDAARDMNPTMPADVEKYILDHLESGIQMLVGGTASINAETARHFAWSAVRGKYGGNRRMRKARAQSAVVFHDLVEMFKADDTTKQNDYHGKGDDIWMCRLPFGVPQFGNSSEKIAGGIVYDADVIVKDEGGGKFLYDVSNLKRNEALTQQLTAQAQDLFDGRKRAAEAVSARAPDEAPTLTAKGDLDEATLRRLYNGGTPAGESATSAPEGTTDSIANPSAEIKADPELRGGRLSRARRTARSTRRSPRLSRSSRSARSGTARSRTQSRPLPASGSRWG